MSTIGWRPPLRPVVYPRCGFGALIGARGVLINEPVLWLEASAAWDLVWGGSESQPVNVHDSLSQSQSLCPPEGYPRRRWRSGSLRFLGDATQCGGSGADSSDGGMDHGGGCGDSHVCGIGCDAESPQYAPTSPAHSNAECRIVAGSGDCAEDDDSGRDRHCRGVHCDSGGIDGSSIGACCGGEVVPEVVHCCNDVADSRGNAANRPGGLHKLRLAAPPQPHRQLLHPRNKPFVSRSDCDAPLRPWPAAEGGSAAPAANHGLRTNDSDAVTPAWGGGASQAIDVPDSPLPEHTPADQEYADECDGTCVGPGGLRPDAGADDCAPQIACGGVSSGRGAALQEASSGTGVAELGVPPQPLSLVQISQRDLFSGATPAWACLDSQPNDARESLWQISPAAGECDDAAGGRDFDCAGRGVSRDGIDVCTNIAKCDGGSADPGGSGPDHGGDSQNYCASQVTIYRDSPERGEALEGALSGAEMSHSQNYPSDIGSKPFTQVTHRVVEDDNLSALSPSNRALTSDHCSSSRKTSVDLGAAGSHVVDWVHEQGVPLGMRLHRSATTGQIIISSISGAGAAAGLRVGDNVLEVNGDTTSRGVEKWLVATQKRGGLLSVRVRRRFASVFFASATPWKRRKGYDNIWYDTREEMSSC